AGDERVHELPPRKSLSKKIARRSSGNVAALDRSIRRAITESDFFFNRERARSTGMVEEENR
ncbi:MAG TPA: hypothetical protein VK509_03065, partial [Polyangiales bacterium]|nr:hypothetical protein [Polyangiales bacterium]